jgi:hypothetical protein
MLRTFWRKMVAPRLVRRLTPGVADLLSKGGTFLAQFMPAMPQAPCSLRPGPSSSTLSDKVDFLQIYRGYSDDDLIIFEVFKKAGLRPKDGFVTDFLGGRTRVATLYDAVKPLSGQIFGPPVPGDFHAEAVEWLGVMKTALTAKDRYVAMEWGAGWAPWLVAGVKAAQHLGITSCRLYGVEADPVHYGAMHQHLVDNGLVPTEHVLLQGAVGPEAGSAQWPVELDALNQWGSRPIREGSADDIDYLNERIDRFIDIDIFEARELVLRELAWDMVHIDIQGWEGEVCRSCIGVLCERVKWVIIGVHSRILDAELLQIFHAAGWILEHEKPTRFLFQPSKTTFEAMVTADGTQVWRNPRLVPKPSVG